MNIQEHLRRKGIKFSHKRLIDCGDTLEVYEYEKPFSYNHCRPIVECDSEQESAEERRFDNLSRARRRVRRLIQANIGKHGVYRPVFVTLTFRENVQDVQYANQCISRFMRSLFYQIGFRMKYVIVPELQERGAIHYHILFFNLPFIRKELFELLWGHGFTNIRSIKKIESIRSVSAYVSKYMTKGSIHSMFNNKKCFFSSRGLRQPYEYRKEKTVDRLVEDAILTGYQVAYEEQHHAIGYGIINYKQYKKC